jgi:hypothetical protein
VDALLAEVRGVLDAEGEPALPTVRGRGGSDAFKAIADPRVRAAASIARAGGAPAKEALLAAVRARLEAAAIASIPRIPLSSFVGGGGEPTLATASEAGEAAGGAGEQPTNPPPPRTDAAAHAAALAHLSPIVRQQLVVALAAAAVALQSARARGGSR